jgi:general stress protein 26
MSLERQRTADLARLGELIENPPVAMLTGTADEGSLIRCPMEALEMDADGALRSFTDLRCDLGEPLRSINFGFADDQRGGHVLLPGRSEIAQGRAPIEELWTMIDNASSADGLDSGHPGLLKFVPVKAGYWDAPGSRVVRSPGAGVSLR